MENVTLENAVLEFAKANKISKAKALEFASSVARMPKIKGPGYNEESQTIRKAVLAYKGKKFTSADIAAIVGTTTVQVNNNLYALQRKKVIEPTGEFVHTGNAGKPAKLWQIIK